MKYFTNAELTKLYNVSDKAIRNWIEATRQGKFSLELVELKGKHYIADSLRNSHTIEALVQQGRKYRNKRSHRDITPSNDFYELYTLSHIIDIMNKLDSYHELPVAYAYFGVGAKNWDKYLHKLYSAGQGNLLTNTIEALELNIAYIDSLFANYKYVNIVNICVGNCLAIKDLLGHLKESGKLKRFVAIDISKDMLAISEHSVKEWFHGELKVEKYLRDISYQRFDEILAQDSFGSDASDTVNLVTFVSGPIVNFKDPDQALNTIRDSMGKDDILITTLKRDTEQTRTFFDFNIEADGGLLSTHHKMLLELLGIEGTFYDIEQLFDDAKRLRFVQIRLKLDISIHFHVAHFEKTIRIKKGEVILLWRSWQHSDQKIIDRFTKTGFEVLQMSRSRDQQLNLLVTRITNSHDSRRLLLE